MRCCSVNKWQDLFHFVDNATHESQPRTKQDQFISKIFHRMCPKPVVRNPKLTWSWLFYESARCLRRSRTPVGAHGAAGTSAGSPPVVAVPWSLSSSVGRMHRLQQASRRFVGPKRLAAVLLQPIQSIHPLVARKRNSLEIRNLQKLKTELPSAYSAQHEL